MASRFDPAAPGRGPGRLGATYNVELIDEEIFIGRFVGVTLGTTKPADTLHWNVDGVRRSTRYGIVVHTKRLGTCPECGKLTLTRHAERDWVCVICGHETDKPAPNERGRPSYAKTPPEGDAS